MNNDAINTLADLPVVYARTRPNASAVIYGDTRLSFGELERRSRLVAAGLRREALPAGSRVAILSRNSELFFEVLFGAAQARAVLVTINFRLAAPEIEFILADAETEVLFAESDFASELDRLRDSLPRLRRIIWLDGTGEDGLTRWRDRDPAPANDQGCAPDDIAVQMYTSGTTGEPKGVALSHRAMVGAARAGLGVWTFLWEENAAVLGIMPLFHIAALNLCIAALFAGARAEITRATDPQTVVDAIIDRGISLVPLPPAVVHAMLRTPGVAERDFSSLQTMLVAGSGISVELLREAQQVFQCGFALSYGSTETCGGLTYLGHEECTPEAGRLLHSAGKELDDAEVRIVSGEGRTLPPGEVGEIVCRTVRLMSGYWRRPEATAKALVDGWYYSGDAGYLDEQGYLYVVDRIKDMVISGGENIYPAEIEIELCRHRAVDDAAVIGVPDDKWGEALLAFVILAPGQQADAASLGAFLRERKAGYKVPRRFEFVSDFPRNATGKVLKRTLREPFWQGRVRQVG